MRVVHWYPNFLAGGGVANSVLALAGAQAAAGADTWIASLAHDDPIYGPLRPADGVRIATWGSGRTLRWGGLRLHALGRGPARALRGAGPGRRARARRVQSRQLVGAAALDVPARPQPPRRVPRHGSATRARGQRACTSRLPGGSCTGRSGASTSSARLSRPTSPRRCRRCGPIACRRGRAPRSRRRSGTSTRRRIGRSGPVRLMFLGRIDVQVKGPRRARRGIRPGGT